MISKLKYFKTTGAISASSKHLVDCIVNTIPEGTNNIIELGIGDGCITKAVVSIIEQHHKLLAVEINSTFFDSFNNDFKADNLITVNADALQIEKIISDNNFTDYNCIISSLPFALMKKKEVNLLLEIIGKLISESNGSFILYQYSTLYEKELREHFEIVSRHYILQNLPPAFIYYCKKK